MPYVNLQRRYIRFKIVFYGPEASGKTTSIQYLNKMTDGKVEVLSLEAEGDDNTTFDYMPLNLGEIRGVDTVFKLYSVPGAPRFNKTRQMLLRDVDGIIFVADSRNEALDSNISSLEELMENLVQLGTKPDTVPLVILYNKRDLPDVLSIDKLETSLDLIGRSRFETNALDGKNVKEALNLCSQLVYQAAVDRFSLIPPAPEPKKNEGESPAQVAPPEPEEEQFEKPEKEQATDPESGEGETVPDLPDEEEMALNLSFDEGPPLPHTIPIGSLGRGVADHIAKTVPPPNLPQRIPYKRLKKKPGTISSAGLFDSVNVAKALEDKLTIRLDKMNTTLQCLVDRQDEFETILNTIRETMERMAIQKVDAHLANFIKDTEKD